MLLIGSLLFSSIFIGIVDTSDDKNSTVSAVLPTTNTRLIDKVRGIGRKQAIGVRGKLMCGNEPVQNATVKLWDNDMLFGQNHCDGSGIIIGQKFPMGQKTMDVKFGLADLDPDDLMAEKHTKPDGTFEISGFATSITAIDPQIRIYHNCRSNSLICKRKVTFTIPDSYINSGKKVTKWFELGNLNMELGVRYKEEPHCY